MKSIEKGEKNEISRKGGKEWMASKIIEFLNFIYPKINRFMYIWCVYVWK